MTTKKSITSTTPKPTRYLVMVLGMHRSGTSALTGLLHHIGCRLPNNIMATSEHNPQGYFEGTAFYQFNIDLLKSADTSWNDWRPIKPSWLSSPVSKAMLSDAREILQQEFDNLPLVVLKDPRICRMVPFWTEAASLEGYQVLPVLTYRNPLEVAKSLRDRNEIEMAEGMLIWLRHVLDAEYTTRGTARFVTSYDQVLTNWSAQVTQMQKAFGITFPHFDDSTSQTIEDFLLPALRHHTDLPEKVIGDETLPHWIRDTYEVLEQWTAKEETKDGYAVLDRVRAELDAITPVFSQLVGPKSKVARSLQAQKKNITRYEEKIAHGKALAATKAQKTAILVSNLEETNERLEAMQNSKSWRITKPLRAFVGMMSRHR